jgi:hypothetical protein
MPDMLLLKSPPGPTTAYSVSERMPTGGALLWFIFHVRSSSTRSMPPRYQLRSRAVECMHHFANRSGVRARTLLVELLLGENTSHAIASRGTIHDSLERSGPHVLLPHPPHITHLYPCIRSPSPSGSPVGNQVTREFEPTKIYSKPNGKASGDAGKLRNMLIRAEYK